MEEEEGSNGRLSLEELFMVSEEEPTYVPRSSKDSDGANKGYRKLKSLREGCPPVERQCKEKTDPNRTPHGCGGPEGYAGIYKHCPALMDPANITPKDQRPPYCPCGPPPMPPFVPPKGPFPPGIDPRDIFEEAYERYREEARERELLIHPPPVDLTRERREEDSIQTQLERLQEELEMAKHELAVRLLKMKYQIHEPSCPMYDIPCDPTREVCSDTKRSSIIKRDSKKWPPCPKDDCGGRASKDKKRTSQKSYTEARRLTGSLA